MTEEKFQPFKAGDWQARQQTASEKDVSEQEIKIERNYPIFKRYLTAEDFSPIFRRCEQSCIELDRFIRTGSREIADEAQYALNAYGRCMQLAAELLELKAKFQKR
jgi:hypothetical protein